MLRKQNLWFIDHLTLQCIKFIRYHGKDVWAPEQELLGECYNPSFHTSESEGPRVTALTSFMGAGTYINECKKSLPGLVDLEVAVRSHLLPLEFCSPWAIYHPNTANAAKEGISYTPISTKHEHAGVCRRQKRRKDRNYPGLSNYHESSGYLWPSPSYPTIYTGNLIRVICSNKSVKWTVFGSREFDQTK